MAAKFGLLTGYNGLGVTVEDLPSLVGVSLCFVVVVVDVKSDYKEITIY